MHSHVPSSIAHCYSVWHSHNSFGCYRMYRKVVASISRKVFLAAGIAITSTDSLFVHCSYVTQVTIYCIFVVVPFWKIVHVLSSASWWMITVWTFCLANLSVVRLKLLYSLVTRNRIWIAKEAWQQLWSFNPTNDLMTAYVECAQLFIEANTIPAEKKVAVFSVLLGARPIHSFTTC